MFVLRQAQDSISLSAAGHASAAVLAPLRAACFRRFESNVKHAGASLPGARTKTPKQKLELIFVLVRRAGFDPEYRLIYFATLIN